MRSKCCNKQKGQPIKRSTSFILSLQPNLLTYEELVEEKYLVRTLIDDYEEKYNSKTQEINQKLGSETKNKDKIIEKMLKEKLEVETDLDKLKTRLRILTSLMDIHNPDRRPEKRSSLIINSAPIKSSEIDLKRTQTILLEDYFKYT